MVPLLFGKAETPDELRGYFTLRHQVFVLEQGIFKDTDIDEYDKDAIHLIAREVRSSQVVGAVRCYRKDDHTWYGGRLAVAREWRRESVGAHLVRLAVAAVKREGCRQFLAYIQPPNVAFFRRLGWKPLGNVMEYMGRPHQLMEADLEEAATKRLATRVKKTTARRSLMGRR